MSARRGLRHRVARGLELGERIPPRPGGALCDVVADQEQQADIFRRAVKRSTSGRTSRFRSVMLEHRVRPLDQRDHVVRFQFRNDVRDVEGGAAAEADRPEILVNGKAASAK
jgi:hypothetical protein